MNYAGPDLGVSVGHTFGAVRPYLTATGAFSQPFQVDNQTPGSTAQADIDQYTSRVYYAIGGIGVCGDTPSGVELSAELNTGVGWQPHGRTNGMFSLSGGLRYRFGAPRKVAPLPPNLDDEPEDDGGGS